MNHTIGDFRMKDLTFVDDYLDRIQLTEQEQMSYQEYFRSKLKQWKIKSPLQLKTSEERKRFYDDVKAGWLKYKQ